MRRRTLINAAIVALIAPIGVWFGIGPAFVKWQLHKRAPDVVVGSAELGWKKIIFGNVSFDRKWISGSSPEVTMGWDGAVDVAGGHVDVDIDKKPTGSSHEAARRTITFHDVTAHVTKGDASADLVGLSSAGTTVCWTEGTATHPKATATFRAGCAERDGSHAHVEQVDVTPVAIIPYLYDGPQDFMGVEYDGLAKTVTVKNVGLLLRDPRGTYVEVVASDVLATLDNPFARARTVRVTHPMLRADPSDRTRGLPVVFKNVSVLPLPEAPGTFRVETNGLQLLVDPASMEMEGEAPCQTWVDALPEGLRSDPLPSLQFTGNFTFHLQVKPKVDLHVGSCKVTTCEPIRALRKTFTYEAFDSKHHAKPRVTGPNDSSWVVLDNAGAFPMAVVNTEDYTFRSHGGFLTGALVNSLQADVTAGKFVRGGSTIEMQLAKNLWLDRTKTLGRKAQELFLSMALDSCLTKDEILETYLNVIEYGPDVYGLEDGTRYWFSKEPSELSPVEAFWLALILPHPETAKRPSPASLKYAASLLQVLAEKGRIPDLADLQPPDEDIGWVANQ
jgi:hypothetical protein